MTKLGLKDDEPQGSREASSSSSSRATELGIIVPEPKEGGKKSKESSADELAPQKAKGGGDETILQEKERIAGRSRAVHTKKALHADDYKSTTSRADETILQEKERIAGRSRAVHTKKALPADDYKSTTSRADETILQEKERVAGSSKTIQTKKAVTPPMSSMVHGSDNFDAKVTRPGAECIAGPFATSTSSIGTIVVGGYDQTFVEQTFLRATADEPELFNAELVQDKTVDAVPITDDGHTHEYQDLQRDYRKLRIIVAAILVLVLIAGVVTGGVVGTQQDKAEPGGSDTNCVVSMDLTCTDSLKARDCASIPVPERTCRFKPRVLDFQYDGGTCPISGGARSPSLIDCVDVQHGSTEANGEEVYIVATDSKTKSTIREQSISAGGEFSVLCFNNVMSIKVYSTRERQRLLQTVVYQCDCSKSLSLQDHLGSLELVSFTTKKQGFVEHQDLINITYTFTVLNEGSGNITLTNIKGTSQLMRDLSITDDIVGETLLSPESFEQFSRIVEIDLSSRQTYIINSTVSAISSTGKVCSDTDTHAFEGGLPAEPTFSPTILPASETPSVSPFSAPVNTPPPASPPITLPIPAPTTRPIPAPTTRPPFSAPTNRPPLTQAPFVTPFSLRPSFVALSNRPTQQAPPTAPFLASSPVSSPVAAPPTDGPISSRQPSIVAAPTPSPSPAPTPRPTPAPTPQPTPLPPIVPLPPPPPQCSFPFEIECVLSDGSQNCSHIAPVRTLCEERPFAMTFRFNAGDCSQSLNGQMVQISSAWTFEEGPQCRG